MFKLIEIKLYPFTEMQSMSQVMHWNKLHCVFI